MFDVLDGLDWLNPFFPFLIRMMAFLSRPWPCLTKQDAFLKDLGAWACDHIYYKHAGILRTNRANLSSGCGMGRNPWLRNRHKTNWRQSLWSWSPAFLKDYRGQDGEVLCIGSTQKGDTSKHAKKGQASRGLKITVARVAPSLRLTEEALWCQV